MAMSPNVYRALMSLDAYNRGYNAGIDVEAAGASKTQIGNAVILPSAPQATIDDVWTPASFYAREYTLNGTKIIAYRGTDILPTARGGTSPTLSLESWTDVWQWRQFLGGYDTGQQRLAADFYRSVKAASGSTPIELTGHSLGGGLAGFIGAIYGVKATMFDNIAFERAGRFHRGRTRNLSDRSARGRGTSAAA